VVENLSPNGTEINGKRYKVGKQVVLATGDVIGVGLETRMLFVAMGDDVEQALADYRQKTAPPPAPAAPAELPEAQAVPASLEGPPAATILPPPLPGARGTPGDGLGAPTDPLTVKPPPRVSAAGVSTKAVPVATPLEVSPAKADASAAQKKLKKYLKFGSVYVAVLAGLIVFLSIAMKTPPEDDSKLKGEDYLLTKQDITKYLSAKLPRKQSPLAAQRSLKVAKDLFDRRKSDAAGLYKVVSNYNVYLAGKDGPGVFEDAEDNRKYDKAVGELVEITCAKYDNAYNYEKAKDYKTAKKMFNDLVEMFPPGDEKTPVQDKLIPNVMKHLTVISKKPAK
jgi:hypothetical protein